MLAWLLFGSGSKGISLSSSASISHNLWNIQLKAVWMTSERAVELGKALVVLTGLFIELAISVICARGGCLGHARHLCPWK